MKDPIGPATLAHPDDAKPLALKDVQIELPGGTIVIIRIEIASVPKVGGGGTPMPGPGPAPGQRALMLSCLLTEHFIANITADVSGATASISMGGGGTPHGP